MGRDYIKYLFLAILAVCTSCIKNDVPYPTVIPSFKTIEVRGSIDGATVISSAKNEVTVVLSEETDIQKVTIGNVTFDPATFGSSDREVTCSPKLEGMFNLETPLNVVLTTYRDYQWRIIATQPIKYDFTIEGQVGESIIDGVNHRVIAYVPEGTDLKNLKVLSYKLGPEKVSTPPTPELYLVSDFSSPVHVTISAHGRKILWEIIVLEREGPSVKIDSLDAWTRVAWVYASGVAGQRHGFVYKKSSDSEWSVVPDSGVTVSGGSFRAALDGLEPQTGYLCRAFSGNDTTAVNSFTTGEERQLPNGGFNVYSHAESKKYYSWYDTESSLWKTKWWDSGNSGSTTVGDPICNPDTKDKTEGAASARLNSRFIVVKFAAGNVFCGEFAGLDGLSGGKVNFGRPWTLRPRKLCFDLKYEPGIVDNVNGYPAGQPVKKGDTDRGQVYIALGDWDYREYGGSPESPVQVNTTKPATFFDPAGPNVIAYGEHTAYESTQGWTHVEIPLNYFSTSLVPTHIIISCASSMLGDYFTGSSSSVMWLDDMKLEY